MPGQPVELHVVSDATGETAARLVQALEAQFPEQEFVEIRHPRVESEDDLHLAVSRMRGRPAVVVYTLVKPELRDAMRTLCRRARLHYCDLLGQPIDAQRLSEIRGERIRWMRGNAKYADIIEIYDELDYAQQVHRRLACPVLEVSELSIEEISHRIIRLVETRKAEAQAS